MDDVFGGVVVTTPFDPQVIVSIQPTIAGTTGLSGFSGFSGSGGGGGGGGGSSFSGYSGKSGYSGISGRSGFSGFSSSGISGFSGYSASGFSGYSGASGASGTSGPGGGNSGYSGFSGLDGTASASGWSGYSGFSSRSGFSGYSGSGISGFSGFSGGGFSGFSGYSGFSGFSAPSGFSGFSGGPSGFSGFSGRSGYSAYSGYSGTGSPPGGVDGNFQYNNAGTGFGGTPMLNFTGGNVEAGASAFRIADGADPTKKILFSLANVPTGTTRGIVVPASANPVVVGSDPGAANQFLTGITAAGVITKAQPSFANLSGLASYAQLDRTTAVVAETPTLTLPANSRTKSTASGTLTTISFSGGASSAEARKLDLDITGGPYTLTIPACRRLGETGTITSLQVIAGYNEFNWEYINGEYVLSDSIDTGGTGTIGASGFSGFSGRSGYSAYSGYSGPAGAGSSGFSGFSGGGGSGFSGFSGPSLIPFSTRNDTDYTLALSDANTGVKMASAVAHSLTVPTNASVPFPIGTQIPVEQGGTAVVSIVAAGGVTLQGATATSGLYSVVVLIKQATDTWLVAKSGDSGYSGYSGGPGSAGSSGFSGFSGGGTSGFSGFSGAGLSGFSGYSSTSGFSGFSGRSGYSGFSGPQLLTFSTQTDVDYTLVLGDANTGVKMSSSSPHNLTIPTNASVAFPIGTQIPIEQGGSGVVTILAAGGVTLQGTTTTGGQFSLLVLIKQATDTWLASSGNSGYSGYSGFSGRSGFSAFSGFSGSGGWTKLTVAGSDVTTTGQTLVDITGLISGTLANATLYEIHAVLLATTTAGNLGVQYGIHLGGSGTVGIVNAIMLGTGDQLNSNPPFALFAPDNAGVGFFLGSSNITGTIDIRGWIVTRSTGTATFSLQHLKVTSGTSTVKVGSYLEYRAA